MPLNYKALFASLSVIFLIIGYIPYFRDILKKRTKPHIYTWLIWIITQGTAALALLKGGGKLGSASLIVGTLLVAIVFFISFWRGTKDITLLDQISLATALLAIIVWWKLNSPLAAVFMVSFIDLVAYIPTIRKTLDNPKSETISFWVMMSLVDIFALLSVSAYNFLTATYLTAMFVGNMMVIAVCKFRRDILT